MKEDDIPGFASQRGPQPTAPRAVARRGRRPWLLLGVLVLLLLVAASGAAVLLALAEGMGGGLTITIDGERWGPFHPTAELWTLAFVGAGAAVLVVLVVVPLSAVVSLLGAALGLGVALLALLAVAAVLLSPLWLMALVLWLMLRRRPRAAATMQG
ncbi:MAG TPA: hypothetical protein VK876_13285 [Rubrivivax sp.]|nr:hypothetical protein [Rubrivivax sp.]